MIQRKYSLRLLVAFVITLSCIIIPACATTTATTSCCQCSEGCAGCPAQPGKSCTGSCGDVCFYCPDGSQCDCTDNCRGDYTPAAGAAGQCSQLPRLR
ncbi:MAG TPA: hypothetical protein EYN06_02100 [Myxococcales bacterium]|nr:hypothetical protein [Myxococcales bacterium]HIN85243.1 hypothetical protein [Myxococcales bacterium]